MTTKKVISQSVLRELASSGSLTVRKISKQINVDKDVALQIAREYNLPVKRRNKHEDYLFLVAQALVRKGKQPENITKNDILALTRGNFSSEKCPKRSTIGRVLKNISNDIEIVKRHMKEIK